MKRPSMLFYSLMIVASLSMPLTAGFEEMTTLEPAHSQGGAILQVGPPTCDQMVAELINDLVVMHGVLQQISEDFPSDCEAEELGNIIELLNFITRRLEHYTNRGQHLIDTGCLVGEDKRYYSELGRGNLEFISTLAQLYERCNTAG